jgi:hypothetical protein
MLKLYTTGSGPLLGGRVTVVEALPPEHGNVTGRPGSAGTDAKVQFTAALTVAATVTGPPVNERELGVTLKLLTAVVGCAATATAIGAGSCGDPPFRYRRMPYISTEVVLLAGRVMVADAEPPEQSSVTGRPGAAGKDVKVHVATWLTWADSVTVPPESGNVVGVTDHLTSTGVLAAAEGVAGATTNRTGSRHNSALTPSALQVLTCPPPVDLNMRVRTRRLPSEPTTPCNCTPPQRTALASPGGTTDLTSIR